MSKIVVVGASGFIGKHLVRRLLEDQNYVIAVLRNKDKFPLDESVCGLKIIECEMEHYDTLNDLIAEEVDVFIYLSWEGNSGPERADYHIQLRNLQGILSAIESAAQIGCQRFIATGTISEKLLELGSLEITSQNMMYAATKASAQKMASVLCKKYGIDFTWLRLGNVYGAGNTTGNLMSYTISALQNGERPTYSSALVLQDFVYVEDCINGILTASKQNLKNNIYYIGTGKPRPLKEFILEVRDFINPSLEVGIGERMDDGTHYEETWFSTEDFVEETGYEVQFTFEEGIGRTIGGEHEAF